MGRLPVRITLFPARSSSWRERFDGHPEIDLLDGADAAQCLDLVARRRVDAVVVDISDSAVDGRDLLRHLTAFSCVPVVACSVGSGGEARSALLDGGATAVVDPDVSDCELAAQLRSLCRLVAPSTSGQLWLDLEASEVERGGERIVLTPTECKLLSVLCGDPGRYFSAAELLERVWGYTTGPTSTVSVHIRRLRLKLEADPSRPRLLRTVRGRGYALVDDEVDVDP